MQTLQLLKSDNEYLSGTLFLLLDALIDKDNCHDERDSVGTPFLERLISFLFALRFYYFSASLINAST